MYVTFTGENSSFDAVNDFNGPEEYFTEFNAVYEDDLEEDGVPIRYDLVEIKFTLVNICEFINTGRLDISYFDDMGEDLEDLYSNFILNDENKFFSEFVDNELIGNIIYIENIETKNGATNWHIIEAILDIIRRFGHTEGITTFYEGQDEKTLASIFKFIEFKQSPNNPRWFFIENDRKMDDLYSKLKLV